MVAYFEAWQNNHPELVKMFIDPLQLTQNLRGPMTEQEAYARADEFRDLVKKRTGLSGSALVCPHEKSEMTPCLARDGHIVLVQQFRSWENPICVGCEYALLPLLEAEKAKHEDQP